MSVTERTYEISPETLFATIVDPSTYPEWLVGAKKIREVSSTWPEPGSFFKHAVGFGPIVIPDTTTASAIMRSHMLELLVRARPIIEARVRFDIAAKESGSVLRMTETPVGIFKLVAPVAQRLIRARNERSLDRLAALVEKRGGVAADPSHR